MKYKVFPVAAKSYFKHITYPWTQRPKTIPALRLAGILEKYECAQVGRIYTVFGGVCRFRWEDVRRASKWIVENADHLEIVSSRLDEATPKGIYLKEWLDEPKGE